MATLRNGDTAQSRTTFITARLMRSELELLTGLEVLSINRNIPLLTVDPVDFEQLNIESLPLSIEPATVDSVDNVQLTSEFRFEDGVWRIWAIKSI